MLSRVAESIYWMSRHRAGRQRRAVRRRDAQPHSGHALRVGPAVAAAGRHDGDTQEFARRYGVATQQRVIHFLTFDPTTPARFILLSAPRARTRARCARSSRPDVGQVNQFYLKVNARPPIRAPWGSAPVVRLGEDVEPHLRRRHRRDHDPQRGGHLGRHLERADKTSRILDEASSPAQCRRRRHDLRRHPVGGRAPFGERVRDTASGTTDLALADRRVPARPRVPRAFSAVPDGDARVGASHFGTPAGMFRTPVEHVRRSVL